MKLFRRLRYSPFLVQLVVTRRCNLACGYCNEFDKVSDPVSLNALKERVDRLAKLGAFSVEFTGGELLLHPDIAELIRYARGKNFYKVMMISNLFLTNEKRIRELNDAGLQELQVSVDGVFPNKTTVKVLKPLRKKLEVLARVAKFRVVLSGVLGASDPQETLEVVRFAKEKRFQPRVLALHDENGQFGLSPEAAETYRQIAAELGNRFHEAKDYRARLLRGKPAPFKCRAGSRYLYVDEFGLVHWCSQTRSEFGVDLSTYGYEDLKREFLREKKCAPFCTVGCARSNSAVDEWRSQNSAEARHLPLRTTAEAKAPTTNGP